MQSPGVKMEGWEFISVFQKNSNEVFIYYNSVV